MDKGHEAEIPSTGKGKSMTRSSQSNWDPKGEIKVYGGKSDRRLPDWEKSEKQKKGGIKEVSEADWISRARSSKRG